MEITYRDNNKVKQQFDNAEYDSEKWKILIDNKYNKHTCFTILISPEKTAVDFKSDGISFFNSGSSSYDGFLALLEALDIGYRFERL